MSRARGLNWVIDPGRHHQLRAWVPCYCISVALMDGADPLIGVVLEVTRDELFTAWKGGGARMNSTPIA